MEWHLDYRYAGKWYPYTRSSSRDVLKKFLTFKLLNGIRVYPGYSGGPLVPATSLKWLIHPVKIRTERE